jgi:hypothetical protein
MEAAGGAIPHPIPLGSCGGRDCRSGTSPVEARGNCVRVYPALQGSQESMLFNRILENEAIELASLGLVKPIKDLVFQLEFNSLAHVVQKLTSYEQRHPELYQDRFKHQVTLIDVEDAEDSRDDQEIAVAEWTRGANPMSCKWVKQ